MGGSVESVCGILERDGSQREVRVPPRDRRMTKKEKDGGVRWAGED